MKRLVILLVVLGLLMAFPAAVSAGPDCDTKPDHPLCGDGGPDGEFMPGYPCSDAAPVTEDFTVVLDADNSEACVDVESVAGDWEFTITTTGRVSSLWMVVKDSQPGDFCYEADLWRKTFPGSISHFVPAASIDACDGLVSPRGYTDSTDSLVFGAMMGGRGAVTIVVDLP